MTATPEISFTDRFWPSVHDLAPNETKQVVKAVTQLCADPPERRLAGQADPGRPERPEVHVPGPPGPAAVLAG